MSTTLGVSPSPSSPPSTSVVRQAFRNLFRFLGFEPESESFPSRAGKRMAHSSQSRGFFPALPRDYIRRRRVMRRISDVVLVVLLSAAVAYAIVHVSGPSGFPAPHH